MYYDDPYDPNLPNDYDEPVDHYEDEVDNQSAVSSSTIDTRRLRQRKLTEDAKTLDKGYAVAKLVIGNLPAKIPYYHTSYHPGSTIRNAVTGIYQTPHSVGKPNQDLYFKVIFPVPSPSDAHQLFYDSPDQYEKHFHCQVSDAVRKKWNDRVEIARAREQELYNKEAEKRDVVIR
jgi:hypothetical protein